MDLVLIKANKNREIEVQNQSIVLFSVCGFEIPYLEKAVLTSLLLTIFYV
jgi:hypothetical protein